jgi:hypothetical protein
MLQICPSAAVNCFQWGIRGGWTTAQPCHHAARQPVAVVFDLVYPVGPGRRPGGDFRTGMAYLEAAADEADRETVIRNFIGGQVFGCAPGDRLQHRRESRDVSEDIAGEVLDRAYDADETLTGGTQRFIDRHITPGEKRPAAPSARRGVQGYTKGRAVNED